MSTPRPTRLPSGELRRQVAEVLAHHPATDFLPREIAKKLGDKSVGAVGNALVALVSGGYAAQTTTTPARYQATSTTPDAAKAKVTVPPSSAPRVRTPKPRTPAPVPPHAPVSGPVPRPNGMSYHPRTVAGIPDVTALRKARHAEIPVILYGPPGTGKTALAEAAFGRDLYTVQGDGDTTVADLVGEYTQAPDGRFVFVHGPLIRAMRDGAVLFVDDATLIPPTVLAVMYPAMDGRREVIVKANSGEVVTAAPGFYVIAGHNPGVHGAVLTEALASRFSLQIKVTTDYTLAEALGVDRDAVKVARNLATRQDSGEIGWAPQLRELLAYQKISDALGRDAAAANLISAAPEEDRQTVAGVVKTVYGQGFAPLTLGPRI